MSRAYCFRKHAFVVLFIVLLITQLGCSLSATATPAPTPTLAPTSTPTLTKTPTPTATNTPTLTSTATPDRIATQGAKASATMDARMAKIAPKLEKLGVDPQGGKLAWYGDKPITLAVDQYNSFYPEVIVEDSVADFVMHTSIVWDSSSGLAGCGILFRSEEDLSDGAHYELDLMRLQNAPLWGMFYVKYNRMETKMGQDFDNNINDGKDSVNTVDLIAQGSSFTFYINGEKIRTLESSKLESGQIVVMVHQESGFTVCTFKDAWVWELETKDD